MSKPFTLKIVEPKTTWFGRLKYITLFERQYKYPEPMWAEASKYKDTGMLVWTYGPDLNLWNDDRVAYVDKSFSLKEVLAEREESLNSPAFDHDGEAIPF